jgi:hypothetical protein
VISRDAAAYRMLVRRTLCGKRLAPRAPELDGDEHGHAAVRMFFSDPDKLRYLSDSLLADMMAEQSCSWLACAWYAFAEVYWLEHGRSWPSSWADVGPRLIWRLLLPLIITILMDIATIVLATLYSLPLAQHFKDRWRHRPSSFFFTAFVIAHFTQTGVGFEVLRKQLKHFDGAN